MPEIVVLYFELKSILVRHLNNEGYIITAYTADKMKKGKVIWQKKS